MNGIAWTFFFKPPGWDPQEGEHAAELFFMDPAECPALAMTEAGIVIPGSKPKRVRTRPNRPGLLILSLLCLGIAGLLMVGSWRSYLANIDAPRAVIATDALVVARNFLRSKPGESHGLKYRFALPDGQVIESRWMDEDKRWKAYRIGDRIRIQYLADNPEQSCPERACHLTPTLSMTIFMSAFGIPLLLIGCFLMIRILRHP